VMGNMAETYELSSIKSAGTPLLRVMRPLIIFASGATLLSYYCSTTLIPLANLKFGSRMYDVQQQKPALRLDEGIFNDDFQGFSIHIGQKGGDGKTIKDVLIYDHSENSKGQYSQITAKEGEMYTTPDGQYFVMNLKDGHQYIEVNPSASSSNSGKYPFVRTAFKQWTKVFDMGEFDLSRTNPLLFKNNKSMMSIPELKLAIDSADMDMEDRILNHARQTSSYFHFLPPDSVYTYEQLESAEKLDTAINSKTILYDADTFTKPKKQLIRPPQQDSSKINVSPHSPQVQSAYHRGTGEQLKIDPQTGEKIKDDAAERTEAILRKRQEEAAQKYAPLLEALDSIKALDSLKNFADIFEKSQRLRHYDRAKTFILSVLNQSESTVRSLQAMREQRVKYSYEMWTKYSIALACVIFVFVGAPMGAIVRKGGFGYPILISIIFFMIFVILSIFCRKIAEAFVLPAMAAAWVPAIIMTPIGVILTLKAMNDSSLQISETVTRIVTWFNKRKMKA
ncbi:MAG: LptF/LptG family permease, partial [Saprospiraceae bacterium]|nr:LptF/LptG family permease [Saprospiraceae bacterium]